MVNPPIYRPGGGGGGGELKRGTCYVHWTVFSPYELERPCQDVTSFQGSQILYENLQYRKRWKQKCQENLIQIQNQIPALVRVK